MPNDIFQPNAAAQTAIAVFAREASPHTQEDKVVFYSLKDDGFKLSKNKGRTDPFNNWVSIKQDLLKKIKNPIQNEDQINLVFKSLIDKKDEWIIQAHSKIDYSQLSEEDFLKTIREYIVFSIKKDLNLLNQKIDELKMFEIFQTHESLRSKQAKNYARFASHQNTNWGEFELKDVFNFEKGERLIEMDKILGDIPFVTASSYNNGITSFISFDGSRSEHKKLFKNKITIDVFGNVFLSPGRADNYFSSDNVYTLSLKSKKNLSIYTELFLVSIFRKLQEKYSFGRKITLQRLEKESIKLPVKQNSKEPDWQFMEDYIKSLPYSNSIDID